MSSSVMQSGVLGPVPRGPHASLSQSCSMMLCTSAILSGFFPQHFEERVQCDQGTFDFGSAASAIFRDEPINLLQVKVSYCSI